MRCPLQIITSVTNPNHHIGQSCKALPSTAQLRGINMNSCMKKKRQGGGPLCFGMDFKFKVQGQKHKDRNMGSQLQRPSLGLDTGRETQGHYER